MEQAKKTTEQADTAAMLKCLVFTSLISADNDEYPEDIKQEVLERHKEEDVYESEISEKINWKYVFEPLGEDAKKYVKIMEAV